MGREARGVKKAGSNHASSSYPLNRLDLVGPLDNRVTGSDLHFRNVTL